MHDIIYETKKKNIPSRFFFEEMDSSQFPNGRTMTVPIGDQLTISGNKRNGYEAGVYFDDQRQPTRNFSIPGVNYYFDGTANREPSVLGGNGATFHQHANVIRTSAKDVHFTLKKFANNFHQMWIPGQWIFSLNNIGATELSHAEYPRINTIYPSPAATVGVTPIQLNAILAEAEKKCNAAYQKEKGSVGESVGGRYDRSDDVGVKRIDFIRYGLSGLLTSFRNREKRTTKGKSVDNNPLVTHNLLYSEQDDKPVRFESLKDDVKKAIYDELVANLSEVKGESIDRDDYWPIRSALGFIGKKNIPLFYDFWADINTYEAGKNFPNPIGNIVTRPQKQSSQSSSKVQVVPEKTKEYDTEKPITSLLEDDFNEVEWSERDGSKIKSVDADKDKKKKAVIEAAYKSLPSLGWCNGYFILNHVRLLGVVDSIQDSTEHGRVDVSIAVCGGTHTMNFWGPFLEHGDRAGFMINKVEPSKFEPSKFNPFQVIAYRNPMAFVPGIPIDRSGKSKDIENSAYPNSRYIEYVSSDIYSQPAINFRAGIVSRRDPVDYVGLADCDATSTYARQCVDLLGPSTITTDAGLPRSDPAYTIAMADSTARVVYMHVATS